MCSNQIQFCQTASSPGTTAVRTDAGLQFDNEKVKVAHSGHIMRRSKTCPVTQDLKGFALVPSHMPATMLNKYKQQEATDAVLMVEGQELHVHQAVLAAVSPVFACLFSKPWDQGQPVDALLSSLLPLFHHSVSQSLAWSLNHALSQSVNRSFIHCLINPFIHPLVASFLPALTHAFSQRSLISFLSLPCVLPMHFRQS